MDEQASRELARQLDARDPLARFRKQFYRPSGQIYLDGNSLGLFSFDAERALLRVVSEWKTRAIDGWNEGESPWLSMSEKLAARVAKLIGAAPEEVAIANSATVNLHQLLATLYRRQFHRPRIVIDGFSFPSDRSAIRSHLELRVVHSESELLVVEANAARLLEETKLEETMADPTVQMIVLPMVVSTTGQLLDAPRLCATARRYGVLIGLDLSHSLGVIPHALDEWDADFAFWGHDKYANAGPGAVAGLYLNRRHFAESNTVTAGLAGRWSCGKEWTSEASDDFQAGNGATALQIGAPPILSMAPLDGSLRSIEEAGIDRIRAKSLSLTQFLRSAIESEIPTFAFATPKEPERRGGHMALLHPAASAICQLLRKNGMVADFHAPDIIRLAPVPLYISFLECWDAVQILRRIVDSKSYEQVASVRELVT